MSFISGLVDSGKKLFSSNTGGTLAKAAAIGFMLKQVTSSSNKKSDKSNSSGSDKPDYGVREQIDPDTDSSIPVLYGSSFLGGNITDAVLTNDSQTMWYCITLCEQTGNLLSTGDPSVISFEEVYWNQNEIVLHSDGYTAYYFIDEDGKWSTDIDGLIEFYFYSGNSASPVSLGSLANPGINATTLFPNWTSNHSMPDTVFCIVKVKYDKDKSVTGLGRMEFKLTNTMTQPGDCLNDYMTNERYGAGIPPEDINS